MTDEDKAIAIRSLVQHPGWGLFVAEMRERAVVGLEKFINLPAEKMTTKVAQEHKANYKVLRDVVEWPTEQLRRLEK